MNDNEQAQIDTGAKKRITFGHTGDLGDVIYALATMKAICERDDGFAEIVLYRGPGVREPFDEKRALNIGDLLMELPWVGKFKFWPGRIAPGDVDYDFSDWRDYYGKYCDKGRGNLAKTPAEFFRVNPNVVDTAWITGIKACPIAIPKPDGGPHLRRNVLIARSHRYRDPSFPWMELADRYRHSAVAVGTPSELSELQHMYDFYASVYTPTLLDVAQVIAGVDLVITNQTATYALAEAMKKPCVLERCPWVPNVDFDRPDVWSGERVKEFLAMDDPFTSEIQPLEETAAPPQVKGVRKSA